MPRMMLAGVLAMLGAWPLAAAPAGPAVARAVVVDYYAALDRHDYRTAYLDWDRDGQASGQRYATFRRGFAQTRRTRATVGVPTDQEGAAGSTFITVPVDVRATLRNGRRQHSRGSYVLRRVNDVDGATAAQRRWHIDSARLVAVR